MMPRYPRRPPGRGHPPGRRSFRHAAEADAEHHRLIRVRAALLLLGLALAMLGLGARLVSLHIVQAGALEQIAERQQLGTLILDPRRGRLLDRSGRPLAVNVDVESVFAIPSKIANPAKGANFPKVTNLAVLGRRLLQGRRPAIVPRRNNWACDPPTRRCETQRLSGIANCFPITFSGSNVLERSAALACFLDALPGTRRARYAACSSVARTTSPETAVVKIIILRV